MTEPMGERGRQGAAPLEDRTCEAYLWVGEEPVPCHLAHGHKVQHSGFVEKGPGGTVRWSDAPRRSAPRSVGPDEVREVRSILKGWERP